MVNTGRHILFRGFLKTIADRIIKIYRVYIHNIIF